MMQAIIPNGHENINVIEVPKPQMFPNSILCRMTHSLISQGTEALIIRNCMGLSDEDIKENDVRLGYCGVGIIEEIQGKHPDYKVGDRIAVYGGPYVSHRQYNVVPFHLAVPIPDKIKEEEAIFMGLGAIALHGIRIAQLEIGEICYVGGLGIIGNLCVQLALLAGARVVAADYSEKRLNIMHDSIYSEKADCTFINPDLAEEYIEKMTECKGADQILMCMATKSSAPMEQAIELVRQGGKVVILGDLNVQVPRDDFFHKEASLTISRAAGPGRYNPIYERDGVDYPYQYVRWTEGRNLQEIMRLISNHRLNIKPMISKKFHFTDAPEQYRAILNGTEDLGFIIDWNQS